jgi:hypothetical protein
MLHKDCYRKGTLANKKSLTVILKRLGAKKNCLAVHRQSLTLIVRPPPTQNINPPSRQREDHIPTHRNGLGTNMHPDGPRNQEPLRWRGPAAVYWTGLIMRPKSLIRGHRRPFYTKLKSIFFFIKRSQLRKNKINSSLFTVLIIA